VLDDGRVFRVARDERSALRYFEIFEVETRCHRTTDKRPPVTFVHESTKPTASAHDGLAIVAIENGTEPVIDARAVRSQFHDSQR
jgi:hypothetical protein